MSDQWTERLSEYLDGELAEGERAALESHLESCARLLRLLDRARGGSLARARTAGRPWPRRRPLARYRQPDRRRFAADTIDLDSGRRQWSFSLPQLAAAGHCPDDPVRGSGLAARSCMR